MTKIKILIATHKAYDFPNDVCYLPIQVGKANCSLDLGVESDDSGENISDKNPNFCELTALYWGWKNLENYEYIGLVHYRRYFSGLELNLKGKKIASQSELLADLAIYDVIVAKKRNYYIESVYTHYKNAHFIKDLDITKQIIEQYFPEYMSAFHQVMERKTLHLFNMFVMSREHFVQYCEWLFSILFKLEKQIDISSYDNYQKRVFGFIAERLFNVWLVKNQLKLKERKVVSLEGEHILKKVIGLLKRKYLKKK
ncbi:DUF4422 domain-containing protein [Actinobacillus indolicus]|uniref:DUF4422 domain-containing protein n=1 Tax=Actinobacillus indolicus TaxID=51049 RepID=A0A4P7CJL9_9PAST|nr:DUF4422 domain-containing protein [Actinobacillus indolicus]QBQ63411.1 DUF4422 domain-containing protein [Actinobacillus indolicus]